MYDYKEVMKKDVEYYLTDYCDEEEVEKYLKDCYELYDDLWIEDSVTGNGSGAYFNTESEAKAAVMDNLPLLVDSLRDFGSLDMLAEMLREENWSGMDVTIRCGLLAEVCDEVLEEMKEKRLDNAEEM